jgi:hypothetical protein
MIEAITNVDEWMSSNGINRKWAFKTAKQVKKEYPHLGQAMKDQNSNRPELDLILLIHHVLNGRFPVQQNTKDPTDG